MQLKESPRVKIFNIQDRTFEFSVDAIHFVKTIPFDLTNRIMCGQLVKSATSVGANVAEAQASESRREFSRYYRIALKSCNETKFWLKLVCHFFPSSEATRLYKECEEIGKILARSVMTLRSNG